MLSVLIYGVASATYFACAAEETIYAHTKYNHFSHLADAWLNGHFHLEEGPPAYAQRNDFARYEGRWYVSFPPFPALLLMPLVAIAGEPELVRDGQFFLWLAGLGPVCLFLLLQRLRAVGYSQRPAWVNALLALCFAFGSVYFFSAEQGTVWFAAHIVGVSLCALYARFALRGAHPLLAGLCLGFGFLTRAPLLFAFPLFALEALRACTVSPEAAPERSGAGRFRRWLENGRSAIVRVEKGRLLWLYLLFALPILACIAFTLWHNDMRFDGPFDTGYKHLTVAWQARMKKWGLFHYHYLAKNLGVMLTSLPWLGKGDALFRINAHGLALWFTTPLYLWLLWPKERPQVHRALWLTVLLVALPTLLYQNTGWAQFGYRFSNDYAVFLFALLAIGGRRFRFWFIVAVVWALVVNGFGAISFERSAYKKYYYFQSSQKTLYQPD